MKECVEWLYALLHYSPTEQLDFARYSKPRRPYEAGFWTTNTGVPVHSLMTCGHNPFLVARLAKDVALVSSEELIAYLQWTEPDRLVCHPQSHYVVERIPGLVTKAPVHLPMRIIPDFP